jgi:UDP-N-acetylglucosamine acyltransferase
LIHPSAIIDPAARIAEGVSIGPWTYIGPEVEIGAGCRIESHVVIKGPTRMGQNNRVFQFSTLGEDTPDLKYRGEPTTLTIGDNNIFREGVTIHRGTVQDRGDTLIGNDNLLMAYVHVGHDSVVGNHCILVNNAALAGHVVVNDWAILGGYTLVHQFCHVGQHAFTGMGSAVGKDIPAYVMVTGAPAQARSINMEGLKRRGFSKEDIAVLNKAFKTVYRRGLTLDDALLELQPLLAECAQLGPFIQSLENSSRGIVR